MTERVEREAECEAACTDETEQGGPSHETFFQL